MTATEQYEARSLVRALEDNARFQKESQPKLREFVTDKSVPLDERFRVWSTWCEKKDDGWIPARGDFGIIGNLVRDGIPYDYDRHRVYTWEDFLSYAEDDEVSMSVEQFKELLIETNFGSFTMDW
jgi:hypothetical protein